MDNTENPETANNFSKKRRSSILKNQRPPRTPFCELEFNVVTPPENTKGRRVSFSRLTGVAEFITHEATNTWKNVYEEKNTLESSGNDSDLKLGKQSFEQIGRNFDLQFQEMEAEMEIVPTLGSNKVQFFDTSFADNNFTQQLADLEPTFNKDITNVKHNIEMSSLVDQNSKLFKDEVTNPTIPGFVNMDYSIMQPIVDSSVIDVKSGDFPINTDLSHVNDNIALNMTLPKLNDDVSDMSITETIQSPRVQMASNSALDSKENKLNLDYDIIVDKENIAVNPYTAPSKRKKSSTFNLPTNVPKFDGKKLVLPNVVDSTIDTKLDTNIKEYDDFNIFKKTIDLSFDDGLPNFIASTKYTSNKDVSENNEDKVQTLIDDEHKSELKNHDDSTFIEQNVCDDIQKSFINETNISMTQALPSHIIEQYTKEKSQTDLEKTADNQNNSIRFQNKYDIEVVSMTDFSSKTSGQKEILNNVDVAHHSLIKPVESLDIPKTRKSVLYDESSRDISMTSALPPNIINNPSDKSYRNSTNISYGGDISITQALPTNLMFTKTDNSYSESITHFKESAKLLNIAEKRKTIIHLDTLGDISITQAVPTNIKTTEANASNRKSIKFSHNETDISMTQALPPNIVITESKTDHTADCITKDISITRAVPYNLIVQVNNITTSNGFSDVPDIQKILNKVETLLHDKKSDDPAMSHDMAVKYITNSDTTVNPNYNHNVKEEIPEEKPIIKNTTETEISTTYDIGSVNLQNNFILKDASLNENPLISNLMNAVDGIKNVESLDHHLKKSNPYTMLPVMQLESKNESMCLKSFENNKTNISSEKNLTDNVKFLTDADQSNESLKEIVSCQKYDSTESHFIPALEGNASSKQLSYSSNLTNTDKSEPTSSINYLSSQDCGVTNSYQCDEPIEVKVMNNAEKKEFTNNQFIVCQAVTTTQQPIPVKMDMNELAKERDDCIEISSNLSSPASNVINANSNNQTQNDTNVPALANPSENCKKSILDDLLNMSSSSVIASVDTNKVPLKEDNDDSKNVTVQNEHKSYCENVEIPNNAIQESLPILDICETKGVDLTHQSTVTSQKIENSHEKEINISSSFLLNEMKRNSIPPESPLNLVLEDRRESDSGTKPLNVTTTRQSVIFSREELLSNISMAQALLQKSRLDPDESENGDETIEDSTVDNVNPVCISSEVVKKLQFEEDSVTETLENQKFSLKKNLLVGNEKSDVAKTKVIPNYLESVTDGLKNLMSDLIKPTADVIPFENNGFDKYHSNDLSMCNTEVQANLITSSQIDLNAELESKTPSRETSFSRYSINTKTIPSEMSENKSPVKNVIIADYPISNKVVLFDHTRPLNNVVLTPECFPANCHTTEPNKINLEDNIDDYVVDDVDINFDLQKHTLYPSGYAEKNGSLAYTHNTDGLASISEDVDMNLVKDEEVNTAITMKKNEDLLDGSLSLTLVDDSDVSAAEIQNAALEDDRSSKGQRSTTKDIEDKIESDHISDSGTTDSNVRPKKRIYSPTKSPKLGSITPKQIRKLFKLSKSPKTEPKNKDSETLSMNISLSDKEKSPKHRPGSNITVQQLIMEYQNIQADISRNKMTQEMNRALEEVKMKSVAVVESIDSVLKTPDTSSLVACKAGPDISDKSSKYTESDVDVNTLNRSSHNCSNEFDPATNVISKIDLIPFMGSEVCEWERRRGDSWSLWYLRRRIRLSARVTHAVHSHARHVRADTPLEELTVEIARRDADPLACVCAHAAHAAMARATTGAAVAGDVAVAAAECAGVARRALRWGRAMQVARARLAYTINARGHLSMKVANIPLRSVWEVQLTITTETDGAPQASNVRVSRVVAEMGVPPRVLHRVLAAAPQDWRNVPYTIWKVFKYLKNLTPEEAALLEM